MSIIAKATNLTRRTALGLLGAATLIPAIAGTPAAASDLKQITIDWAYYNPVSLILKDQKLLEDEFKADGIRIRWVQSHGSNKAIEFLNSRSADFASTAGAAALLAKINGSPINAIYVYSKPEWTALVTNQDSDIQTVEDLRGKRVAVTRGTDPYIFLLRALADHGLTEDDIKPVLLQHADGGNALKRGQVDAWAGLDPMMAGQELKDGARLFFRDPDLNTYGFLNTRTAFAEEHPEIVNRVLSVYEKARAYAIDNPDVLRDTLAKAARLEPAVAEKQLERTDLSNPFIGAVHAEHITAAGIALQSSGIIADDVDVAGNTNALIDTQFVQPFVEKQASN
ncbi:MAG: aliphatic sulfonate ABC transporter substrate-binding protein [Alphaproteobacteria bacterium]|nr:aliphatic sulfonate ABC transporter substrate-binding protein [Alphaproteobacteria bacterium SS10]